MGENVSQLLEPIAAWFRTLGVPEPIVHWGHPLMMAIVVFVLGSYVAYAGWRSRTATDGEVVMQNRANHRQLAPWMFLFIALGYIQVGCYLWLCSSSRFLQVPIFGLVQR